MRSGLIALLVLLLLCSSHGSRLAVPSYLYSGNINTTLLPDLDQWALVSSNVSTRFAVANVDRGPGTVAIAPWTAVIAQARRAGVRVAGYVRTDFSARPASQVIADVDTWFRLYGIRNIYFDQVAADACPYYQPLRTKVKTRRGVVIFNPGRAPAECYGALADVLVMYEGPCGLYNWLVQPPWVSKYRAETWHIVHSCPSVSDMRTLVSWKRSDLLYVTDRIMVPSPYSRLPTYFNELGGELAKTVVANCTLIALDWGGPLRFEMELNTNFDTWSCPPIVTALRGMFHSLVDCHDVRKSPVGNVIFTCSVGSNQRVEFNTFLANAATGLSLAGVQVVTARSVEQKPLAAGVVAGIVVVVLLFVAVVAGTVWFIFFMRERKRQEEIYEQQLMEMWEADEGFGDGTKLY